MIYYVIPCRKNSKGIPHKNRLLWKYTIAQIPEHLYPQVIVTTDDPHLVDNAERLGMGGVRRSDELSGDMTSIKDVMVDVVHSKDILPDDDLVMLYLTYPDRKWEDVESAIAFYESHDASSLLCARKLEVHPFLCFYSLANNKGKSIVDHDLYRRQDYPECFALSHFVSIFRAKEVENLNENMYNTDTVYCPIEREPLDIDTEDDLKKLGDQL